LANVVIFYAGLKLGTAYPMQLGNNRL